MNQLPHIKIFVDAHVIDGEYQGTRTFIEELYKAMVNKPGIQLFIAANNISELKNSFDEDSRITYLQYRNRNRIQRILIDIPGIIRKYKIDYAHFQYIIPFKIPAKIIVTTHDVIFRELPSEFNYPYKIIKSFLYKRSVNLADIITTVSEHSRNSILNHFKPKQQIHLVPNGINCRFFDKIERTKAKEYIYDHYAIERFLLCVSRIEPRKNHALMVRSFMRLGLAAKGYYLVFLGSPSHRVPCLEREMKKLSALEKEKVLFLENIRNEELKYFMRAASVFLYPSKGEGFGIPPLEAAAMHTPVICSNTTAMQEFRFFNEDHIDPQNEELFEKRIESNIQKFPGDEQLSERAKIIREKYSWERSADIFYHLIKSHHQKLKA